MPARKLKHPKAIQKRTHSKSLRHNTRHIYSHLWGWASGDDFGVGSAAVGCGESVAFMGVKCFHCGDFIIAIGLVILSSRFRLRFWPFGNPTKRA